MAEQFAALMDSVARTLLGEPNARMSSEHELRYGSRGSLAVNLEKGTWYDHEANEGGGTLDLIEREKHLTGGARLDWLRDNGLLEPKPNGHGQRGKIVATYNYEDEFGVLLFQVVRFDPKDFRQRRPDKEKPDGWNWSVRGVKQVPYKLPELIEALGQGHVVFVCEGEKDVDNLRNVGVTASTNAGGVGKWKYELTEYFTGADVVIVPDYDPQKKHPKTGEPMFHRDGRPILPGQDHAQAVAAELHQVASRVRVLELWKAWPQMPPKGDISDWLKAGGTPEQLYALIEQLDDWTPEPIRKGDDEPPPWESPPWEPQPAQILSLNEWDAGEPFGAIPPRQWLLGTQFCRGFISSIVAAGGVGKTALRTVQLISMALGRSLCGQHVFHRSRVMILNFEDDDWEIKRRLKAVLDFYEIDQAELKGWLWCRSPKRTKLAKMEKRERIIGPLKQQIVDAIQRRKPDLISLDPFVKTHSLEENDSGDMDFVCDALAEIASEYNIAIDSPHHVHKGIIVPGDADSGRGSSGIKDAARLVYTLCPMSEKEAQEFGVADKERHSYVRLDPAKINIAVHSSEATWFRLHGQVIGNKTDTYPNGDTVQVVKPWKPKEKWEGTDSTGLNKILDVIAKGGPIEGQRYSAENAAKKRAVWPLVQKQYPDKTEAQCKAIINDWLKTGLLYTDEYKDAKRREPAQGLFVDDSKRPS
jgi:AAA domain